jgi:class 3 adenylate cyclase
MLKVKTIGSAIMVVGNIDDEKSREDSIAVMMRTAIDIRDDVFHRVAQQFEEKDAVHYSIGITAGPAFGAVIGGNGCIFDIFGDTVNMASRMMSTAENGAIQLSEFGHSCLSRERVQQFGLVERPGVVVKGKGSITAYTVA